MVNNFDKMKSVQTTLNNLADVTSSDTSSVETQETSGSVTAVTGEETKQTDTQQDASAQDTEQEDGQALEAETENEDKQGGSEDVKVQSGENGSDGVYIVEEGDTLAIISKKMYGDVNHVESICKMNGITDGNLIYVGQKLLLP